MSDNTGRKVFRNIIVTVNKVEEFLAWEEAFRGPSAEVAKRVKYAVWQYEIAPTTQRKHIQGYVEFATNQTLNMLKEFLGIPTAHIENRQGTQAQARDYCMKQDTRHPGEGSGPFEYGTFKPVNPGKRNDLINACKVVKESSLGELVATQPDMYVKYHKGMEAYEYRLKSEKYSKEDRQIKVYTFYGTPGTGKTYTAINEARRLDKTWYILDAPAKNQSVWFNGYSQQEVLIVDEMDGHWIQWTQLMRMLDRYPLQVATKGGMTWAGWTTVILTSNKPWTEWYPYYNGGMDRAALERRITMSLEFFKENETGSTTYYQKIWDPITEKASGESMRFRLDGIEPQDDVSEDIGDI